MDEFEQSEEQSNLEKEISDSHNTSIKMLYIRDITEGIAKDFRLEYFCFLLSCISKIIHTFSVTTLTGWTNVNPLSLPDTVEIANSCRLHA